MDKGKAVMRGVGETWDTGAPRPLPAGAQARGMGQMQAWPRGEETPGLCLQEPGALHPHRGRLGSSASGHPCRADAFGLGDRLLLPQGATYMMTKAASRE